MWKHSCQFLKKIPSETLDQAVFGIKAYKWVKFSKSENLNFEIRMLLKLIQILNAFILKETVIVLFRFLWTIHTIYFNLIKKNLRKGHASCLISSASSRIFNVWYGFWLHPLHFPCLPYQTSKKILLNCTRNQTTGMTL